MSCASVSKKLNPACGALKKIAGVSKKFWVFNIADVSAIAVGANGELTTFTLVAVTGFLYPYVGKKEKHNGTFPTVEGENITLFNQTFNAVLYMQSKTEREAVQQLATAEEIGVIAQENDGSLTVWGLRADASAFEDYSLKSAGDGGTGTAYNDDNSYKVAMSGNIPNFPLLYKPAQTLAANILELEALEAA